MRILVTRPLEDGKEIAARLAERGHQALLAPLLEPRFQDGPLLEEQGHELDNVQALLATSANGIRAFIRRSARRDLPVFAVGPQTAKEAREAGFGDVRSADGDAKALAEATRRWASPAGILLHVCAQGRARHFGGKPYCVRPFRCAAAHFTPSNRRRSCRLTRKPRSRQGTLDAADVLFAPYRPYLRCVVARSAHRKV
jgi:hypothetical protein